MFRAEFDVRGFDHVMNRTRHDRVRPNMIRNLNKADVNVVVQVRNHALQVMHSSDLNLQTRNQDSAANQSDLVRRKRVVQRS